MRDYLPRIALTFLTFVYYSLNALAGLGDHGRDYSLNDSGGSVSLGFYVIAGILAVIISSFFISSIFNEKDRSREDKGCFISFFLICIVITIICMINKCNG